MHYTTLSSVHSNCHHTLCAFRDMGFFPKFLCHLCCSVLYFENSVRKARMNFCTISSTRAFRWSNEQFTAQEKSGFLMTWGTMMLISSCRGFSRETRPSIAVFATLSSITTKPMNGRQGYDRPPLSLPAMSAVDGPFDAAASMVCRQPAHA